MASGFFLGGLSSGFQKQESLNNQYDYEQGLLKIAQEREQNQQRNQQRAEFMKLRADGISHLQETMSQLRIAHPDWTEQQLAANPAVVSLKDMLGGFDKNLGLPNTIDSIVAGFAANPQTAERAGLAKTRAQTAEASARAGYMERGGLPADVNNPDTPAPGTGLGTGKQPSGEAQLPAASSPQQSGGLITTPMSNGQKTLVEAAGFTPQTADYEAIKYAFGGDAPQARSKVGAYASNIIKSRGDQYWIDRGVDPQTANAVRVEFKAMQHGATKIADIDARMTTAVAKAQQTAQILTGETGQQLINNVSRSKYKDLNDLYVAVQKRTGNEDEIRLGIALETLASNYGVALGMGNNVLTDFQTQRAQALLQQGWAKGQIRAAVDQLQKEMVREEAGTRSALKTYIGGMQNTMGTNTGQTPGKDSGITVHGFTFTPSQ